jgi:hypothetical protein
LDLVSLASIRACADGLVADGRRFDVIIANAEIMACPFGKASRRQHKKVEMLFAHLKRILKLDRLRLRGPRGVRDEFLLAATARTCASSPNSPRPRRIISKTDFFNNTE